MNKDYSETLKKLIKNYKKEDIVYVKPLDILLSRIKATKEEIEEELMNLKNLEFTEKQEKDEETRYVLFFVHSKRKGRVYVITFTNKIKLITIFPIGRKTLRRYRKKRFIYKT